MSSNGTLHVTPPNVEVIPKIPKAPLRKNFSYNKSAHTYSIVDELEQSPASMSRLEVLQMCPSQRKGLLSTLGDVDSHDDRMIFFDVKKSEHPPCWLDGP